MEIDRIQVALRPRSPWEGLDLGFALARGWFWPLWGLWCVGALPVALILLPLTGFRPDIWLLAVWWLKPLYEAPLLAWSSRALFGRVPARVDLPGLLRVGWGRRILPFLLWRRLGPRRAFTMPVSLLEGLGGRDGRQRRRLLNEGGATPSWLTLVSYHFEIVLWAAMLLGLFFLVPSELPRIDLQSAVLDADTWAYWISALAYVLVFSCIAPFYVCAGFMLYLNRRTELEAWDLELAFRKAAEPKSHWTASARAAPVLLLALVFGAGLAPGSAQAASTSDLDRARQSIQEVLEASDFGQEREVWVWAPIERDEQGAEPAETLPEWIAAIAVRVASTLKWGLMALALVGLALLARRVLRDWRGLSRRPPDPGPEPVGIFESIPEGMSLDAIPDQVRVHLAEGDARGALGLLYRAALLHLIQQGLGIPDGATELECLALARKRCSASELGPLPRLVREWRGLAYAHVVPDPGVIESLLTEWCRWRLSRSTEDVSA